MSEIERYKRQAAERAVEFVEDGMIVGLGTGSTARHALDLLAKRLDSGELRNVVGVPTSRAAEEYGRALDIPVAMLEDEPRPDLVLDGADEVDPELNLIKGLGGALLWEKVVAVAADRQVIMVDERKLVETLGERSALPVEVVPFGWTTQLAYLELLGASPVLRTGEDGGRFVTDGGHYLLDCEFESGILEPERVQRELKSRVGVVETGLFLGIADTVVIAGARGVEVRSRAGE